MYQCSKKLVKYKEYNCFDLSDFPPHWLFTVDVLWGSLSTSIFENSSSAASNTRSRLPFRLSFRFSWLCSNQILFYCLLYVLLKHCRYYLDHFKIFHSTMSEQCLLKDFGDLISCYQCLDQITDWKIKILYSGQDLEFWSFLVSRFSKVVRGKFVSILSETVILLSNILNLSNIL